MVVFSVEPRKYLHPIDNVAFLLALLSLELLLLLQVEQTPFNNKLFPADTLV